MSICRDQATLRLEADGERALVQVSRLLIAGDYETYLAAEDELKVLAKIVGSHRAMSFLVDLDKHLREQRHG